MSEFTNRDHRLRPSGLIVGSIPSTGPREYPIDKQNFNELAQAVEKMKRVTDTQDYKFVILGDNFGGAGTDFKRNVIGIGVRKINALTFDSLLAVIGHELGHVYRHKYPSAPMIGASVRGTSASQMEEIESDRFGACLQAEKESSITALSNGETVDANLPVNVRILAVENYSLGECPVRPTKIPLAPQAKEKQPRFP